jgi:hypothetical protein
MEVTRATHEEFGRIAIERKRRDVAQIAGGEAVACAFWSGATVLNLALLTSVPPLALLALQLLTSVAGLFVVVAMTRIGQRGGRASGFDN